MLLYGYYRFKILGVHCFMNRISVMLVDDHVMMREVLAKGFEDSPFIDIIYQASGGKDAIEYLGKIQGDVDIVLLDVIMPEENGTEVLSQIKNLYPAIKVIMLTSMTTSKYIFRALENDADGYVSKGIGFDQLLIIMQSVYEGKFSNDEKINYEISKCREYVKQKRRLLKDFELLTPRELEVVGLISKGKSNLDIAEELFLSERTVKNHIHNILKKVDLEDRTQIAIANLKFKIVESKLG